ncbi:MAG: CHAP domain-containing protein, partial [Evtepia sp.]
MGIKKSRGTALRKVSASYQVSKSRIKKAKRQVHPMGEDEEREGGETVPSSVPLPHFLNRKEKKTWDRLPERKKQQYIKEASRDVEKKKRARGIAASLGKEEKSQKKEKIQKEKWKIGKAQEEKERVQKGKEMRRQDGLDEKGAVPVSGYRPAGTAAPGRKSGAAPASPAGLTVLIAKRTAERFKEANRRKNTAIESRRVQIQSELSQRMQDNREMGNLKQSAAFVTAAMAYAILAVTAAAIQLAATVVVTMLAILIPVIVVAVVISVVASLIAGIIAALSTTYASGSGEDIVAVAVQEIGCREGPGNETKYGEFTGANGLAWCHSFVSWCANECGFIKMGIIPKTASCEEGRQWFIRHQKYQKKEAGYIPQPGDILYFDYEG